MDQLIEKWDEILRIVKQEHDLSDVSFNTWLKPLSVYSVDHNVVTILVPSEQVGLNYIKKKYLLPLQVTISEVMGMNDCEIRFILPQDVPAPKETRKEPRQDARCEEAHLNPRYTFDSFVVGNNNRLAQAAALAVAESPGEVYNPLFIYGGPGLGKTHLMHSIAHFIIEHNENSKVLYVTSEDFTNELIQAIRNGNNLAMARFREKYRNIDVLLVDDIQFIIGKDSTQEEFFHTFNSLRDAKKAIIMSSDKPPKDMDVLEERFRSRFEWGLIADITAPDYETRMAILNKNLEDSDGIFIPEEILKYIAENINTNIRELEGALNKIKAYARVTPDQPLTQEYAKKILEDIISPDKVKQINIDFIVSVVADQFGISVADIISSKRSAKYVVPRQISMYLSRDYTSLSLEEIGKYLGNRDHSTVVYGIRKIEEQLPLDESLSSTVSLLRMKIDPKS